MGYMDIWIYGIYGIYGYIGYMGRPGRILANSHCGEETVTEFGLVLANSHCGEETVTENVTFELGRGNGGPPGKKRQPKTSLSS